MPSIFNGHSESTGALPAVSADQDKTLPGLANDNIASLDQARQARHDRTKRVRTLFREGRFVVIEPSSTTEEDCAMPDGTA
jgi:hypothetical protein